MTVSKGYIWIAQFKVMFCRT